MSIPDNRQSWLSTWLSHFIGPDEILLSSGVQGPRGDYRLKYFCCSWWVLLSPLHLWVVRVAQRCAKFSCFVTQSKPTSTSDNATLFQRFLKLIPLRVPWNPWKCYLTEKPRTNLVISVARNFISILPRVVMWSLGSNYTRGMPFFNGECPVVLCLQRAGYEYLGFRKPQLKSPLSTMP